MYQEQFGFADIASSGSGSSLSATWDRIKSFSKKNWASRFFSKTGNNKERDEANSTVQSTTHTSELVNTSAQSRNLARRGASRSSQPAYSRLSVFAVTRLYAAFLCRWGSTSKLHAASNDLPFQILNVLSFLKIPVEEEDSNEMEVHLVAFLWSVIQDSKDFEDTMQVYCLQPI